VQKHISELRGSPERRIWA